MIKLRKTAAIMLAAALAICVGAHADSGGFSDVPASAWYNDAVDWAVEEGVAEGTGDGIFSPDAGCTRAQIVTMLYRMQRTGSEALSGEVESVRIENTITEEELNLDAGEIAEFASIFSRAALNDNSVPQMGEEQTSNPMYVVYVGYAGGGEDVFYGTEAGATVIYKRTGTYGPGGPGFIAVRNAEMQSFFDRLGI